MRNFQSGSRSRGGRDSRRPVLHDAVCDECRKNCKVPFRPSGEKPIYCSDCFEKQGGRESNRSGRRDSGRDSRDNRGDRGLLELAGKIDTLNIKLEAIINLLSSKLIETEAKTKEKPKSKTRATTKTASSVEKKA